MRQNAALCGNGLTQNLVSARNNNHPLPNDKSLAWSKLKAFANDKFDVVKMRISHFDIVEKTRWEKEKMLVISILSFSYSIFQSLLPLGC